MQIDLFEKAVTAPEKPPPRPLHLDPAGLRIRVLPLQLEENRFPTSAVLLVLRSLPLLRLHERVELGRGKVRLDPDVFRVRPQPQHERVVETREDLGGDGAVVGAEHEDVEEREQDGVAVVDGADEAVGGPEICKEKKFLIERDGATDYA